MDVDVDIPDDVDPFRPDHPYHGNQSRDDWHISYPSRDSLTLLSDVESRFRGVMEEIGTEGEAGADAVGIDGQPALLRLLLYATDTKEAEARDRGDPGLQNLKIRG